MYHALTKHRWNYDGPGSTKINTSLAIQTIASNKYGAEHKSCEGEQCGHLFEQGKLTKPD